MSLGKLLASAKRRLLTVSFRLVDAIPLLTMFKEGEVLQSKGQCSPVYHHPSVAEATFRNVATAISVYKVTLYSWDVAEADESMSEEELLERRLDLWEAEVDLQGLIDNVDRLPPASRQQLVVLYYEAHCQGELYAAILIVSLP